MAHVMLINLNTSWYLGLKLLHSSHYALFYSSTKFYYQMQARDLFMDVHRHLQCSGFTTTKSYSPRTLAMELHVWQSQVEIKLYSVAFIACITAFEAL